MQLAIDKGVFFYLRYFLQALFLLDDSWEVTFKTKEAIKQELNNNKVANYEGVEIGYIGE